MTPIVMLLGTAFLLQVFFLKRSFESMLCYGSIGVIVDEDCEYYDLLFQLLCIYYMLYLSRTGIEV